MKKTVLLRPTVAVAVLLSIGFARNLQSPAVSRAQLGPVAGRPGPVSTGRQVNPAQFAPAGRTATSRVADPPGMDAVAPNAVSTSQQTDVSGATALRAAAVQTATATSTFSGMDMNSACAPSLCYKVPDGAVATGYTYVVQAVNQAFTVYQRNGARVLGPVSLQSFFNTAQVPYDVRVIFDAGNASSNGYAGGSGRYILVALIRGTNMSRQLVAVSQNSSPTSTSSWCTYSFNGAVTSNGVFSGADYQGLGLDGQYIYMTTDETAFGTNTFEGSRILAVPKASVYPNASSGACPSGSSQEFDNLTNPDSTLTYAIQPANRPYSSAGVQNGMYFVNTQTPNNGVLLYKLAWRSITLVNGVLTLNPAHWVNVAGYNNPWSAPQPNGTKQNEGDTALTGAFFRNGQIYTANSTHHVATSTNVNGYSSVQWYVFTPSGSTTSATTYYLTDPNIAYFDPQLVVACTSNTNPCSSGLYTAMEVTGVSASQGPSAYWYVAGGTPGIMRTATAGWQYTTSWGDYPGVSTDPNNQGRVWLEGEYAETATTWGTGISNVCGGTC